MKLMCTWPAQTQMQSQQVKQNLHTSLDDVMLACLTKQKISLEIVNTTIINIIIKHLCKNSALPWQTRKITKQNVGVFKATIDHYWEEAVALLKALFFQIPICLMCYLQWCRSFSQRSATSIHFYFTNNFTMIRLCRNY